MGILSEPDTEKRELYRRRDEELIERRNFYVSHLKHYPLLDEVMRGRKKFADRLHELHREFTVMQPDLIERILDGEGYHKLARADPYMEKFTPFAEMVDALTEEVSIAFDTGLLVDVLTGKVIPSKEKGMENRINNVFFNLAAYSGKLDRDVRRHFIDILLQENPEVFREEYRNMDEDKREYAEYTLFRMLGAGILKMDELELERIIFGARKQVRGDDDDTY